MNMSSSCGCVAPANTNSYATPVTGFSPVTAEYVAIGAAIGANCEPCLRYHVREAMKVGISATDIRKAVEMATSVKETPARAILSLAERLTQPGGEGGPDACAARAPAASTVCGCSA